MTRMIWKGAISFAVHVPVQLFPATRTVKPSFRLLDKRSMDPVGYRQVNKRTGKEVTREDIVRGYEYEKERYVVLTDDEIRAANPESTQTVDIVTFVDEDAVSFLYLDTPYYLVPDRKGEKVYALLRDALKDSGKIGIAHVVMRDRQHLGALIPVGPLLARYAALAGGTAAARRTVGAGRRREARGVSARELAMAKKLIDDMSGSWTPDEYHDTFRDDILELVERKVRAGRIEEIEDRPAQTAHGDQRGRSHRAAQAQPEGRWCAMPRADDDEEDRAPSPSPSTARGANRRRTSAKGTAKTPAKIPAKRAAASMARPARTRRRRPPCAASTLRDGAGRRVTRWPASEPIAASAASMRRRNRGAHGRRARTRMDASVQKAGEAHKAHKTRPSARAALRFVIQEHHARRLHYDFRLELDGTLKSWAVPKGPSVDPSVKRLAVHVEDHPLEYASFEGEIPAGHYGAPVTVWDEGTWTPDGGIARARDGYRAGKLTFRLDGTKLHGGWALVRSGRQQGRQEQWLLIKERDDDARDAASFDVVAQQPGSVHVGRTKAARKAPARPPHDGGARTTAIDPSQVEGAVRAALPSA